MNKSYQFKSERLGFRRWRKDDLKEFAALNADKAVMKHFPNVLSVVQTEQFIDRLQKHYAENGYCYFAVEVLETAEFIGFIGLAYQKYETTFAPGTDVGWRLKKAAWGKGYATEGAKRCLVYAFDELKLANVFAVCTIGNTKSENVMRKIGMIKMGEFKHPNLKEFPNYEKCLWYEIKNKKI